MRFWVRGHTVPSATVVVAVFRRAGSNAVEVAKTCATCFPASARELPGSVRHRADLRPVADHREQRRRRAGDAVIAFVLVVLVIFVFLGGPRTR